MVAGKVGESSVSLGTSRDLYGGGNKGFRDYEKFSQESRSLYIGHLPFDTTYYDLCKVAHQFGPLELVRLVERKRCAFLNFVHKEDAKQMIETFSNSVIPQKTSEVFGKKVLKVCGRPVRLSWSDTRPIPEESLYELKYNGGSRNLFVFYGNCKDPITSNDLAQKFSKFGEIENIVVKQKKHIAFVNMTSLSTSVQIVKKSKEIESILKGKPRGTDLGPEFQDLFINGGYLVAKYSTEEKIRENYTFERNHPKNQSFSWTQPMIPRNPYLHVNMLHPVMVPQKEPPLPPGWMSTLDEKTGCRYYYNSQENLTQWEHPVTGKTSPPVKNSPLNVMPANSASRALCLQNLPASINYAKLCTLGRQHGLIHSVKIVADKQTAYINYVTTQGAWSLYSLGQRLPISIDGFNLKISWAEDVPLENDLYEAIVQNGANRSVYLRDLDTSFTDEEVKIEFEKATGSEIESIILRPQGKPFGFVNFIDILSAKTIIDRGDLNSGCYTFPDGRSIHVSFVNLKQKFSSNYGSNNFVFSQNRYLNYRQAQQCRSVIISGFPVDTTIVDITSLGTTFGSIESVHLIPAKNHAFINYVLPDSATKFMAGSNNGSGYMIKGTHVRVGFGKSVPIKPDILLAIENNGAGRSIYVSGVVGDRDEIEEKLRDLVVQQCRDDEIESIKINAEKNFAFITLTSITAAKKIINNLKDVEFTPGVLLRFSYARPQALNSV